MITPRDCCCSEVWISYGYSGKTLNRRDIDTIYRVSYNTMTFTFPIRFEWCTGAARDFTVGARPYSKRRHPSSYTVQGIMKAIGFGELLHILPKDTIAQ